MRSDACYSLCLSQQTDLIWTFVTLVGGGLGPASARKDSHRLPLQLVRVLESRHQVRIRGCQKTRTPMWRTEGRRLTWQSAVVFLSSAACRSRVSSTPSPAMLPRRVAHTARARGGSSTRPLDRANASNSSRTIWRRCIHNVVRTEVKSMGHSATRWYPRQTSPKRSFDKPFGLDTCAR